MFMFVTKCILFTEKSLFIRKIYIYTEKTFVTEKNS